MFILPASNVVIKKLLKAGERGGTPLKDIQCFVLY